MGEPVKPEGADFTQGVAWDAVPEGGMLSGQAHGEAVLLCRVEDAVYAVSATCPHYSAPLADGVIIGNTIRCPWHHAAFALRDGAIVSPPAINPLPCWQTEVVAGKVFVRGSLAPSPAPPPRIEPDNVVILGAGAAGLFAAETLRKEGYGGPVILLSADPDVPSDKPNLSKEYLAGTAPEEWVPLRPREFFDEQRIDLRLGTRVTAIDTKARVVRLAGSEPIAFDRLLIATGAEPVRVPIPGSDLPHVHLLRTLTDSRAIIARVTEARRVVIIGASFIGLETAASLITRGLEVHVVAPDAVPLARVFGPELGNFVRSLHEEKGVVFHLGSGVSAIESDRIMLASGDSIPCDFVVMGTGVRPSTRLAEEAGLRVENGIVVDEYLQTSEPGIYVAGDVARWLDHASGEHRRVEHWVVAQRQGQTAARNILGAKNRFDSVPFFWSAHYDVTIGYVGYAPAWDTVDVQGDFDARNIRATYRSNGRVAAVATIFRDRESLEIEAAMERRDWDEVERIVTSAVT